MSVEEIRAQRRDLGESEEAEEGHEEKQDQTSDIEISENGTLNLESVASDTNEETPKAQEAKDPSHPPVGSLADLTISPPGSPVPTSPVVTSIDTGRVRSPGPGARPATHSRSNEAYLQTVLKRRASNSADDFAEKMRTAAVMLAQLNQQQSAQQAAGANTARSSTQSRSAIKAKATSVEDIRAKIIKEMMALEEQRMQRMRVEGVSSGVGGGGGEGAGSEMLEDERKVMANVATDDPSGKLIFIPVAVWVYAFELCLDISN